MKSCLHERVVMVPVFMLVGLLLVSNAWSATLVVANKAEATVSLIDLDDGRVAATLATGDGPHEVDVSADGRFALVTNYGRGGQSGNSLTCPFTYKPFRFILPILIEIGTSDTVSLGKCKLCIREGPLPRGPYFALPR